MTDKHVEEPEKDPEDAPEADEATTDPAERPEAGAEAAGAEPKSEPPEPEAEKEPLEHQLLRLRADFDNYRKRMVRERADWNRQALRNLVEDLLPVLDHFELGLANAREHDAQPGVLEGFELVEGQLTAALRKYELEAIDAADATFDPAWHEALSFLPSPEVAANTVITQVRRGYRLGDQLLRPAQVVVSSGTPDTAATEDEHVDD